MSTATATERNPSLPRQVWLWLTGLPGRVHRDERGTISIVTVFTLLMFTMLMVMIINVAKHLDDKLQMQNAADASAYSSGVVLARGMNTVAFSNHLICDVFAITAFLREGGERNAETLTPELLDEWDQVAQKFSQAEFQKFRQLGSAMQGKIPLERQLVPAFGNMTEVASELALPVFEAILRDEMIPQFQRVVVQTTPQLAQMTANEVAYRHGLSTRQLSRLDVQRPDMSRSSKGEQVGILWRMQVLPVGIAYEDEPLVRTLPLVDPSPVGADYALLPNPEDYYFRSLTQREELSKWYLEQWNADKLRVFDEHAELSQFNNLWRVFTAAHLEDLLAEYPEMNLLMVIRDNELQAPELTTAPRSPARNVHIDQNYHFLGVVYRKHLREMGPGIFRNPLAREADAQTYSQISLFVPAARSILITDVTPEDQVGIGGTFGFSGGYQIPVNAPPETDPVWVSEGWPWHWDLLNQNWMVKLVPATSPSVPAILQSNNSPELEGFRLPDFGGASTEDINRVNTH